jgi:signal transduction histidine kinase
LVLRVHDDGLGMDPRQRLGTGSLGLMGMRERVRQLSGEFAIESEPGAGTTIVVRVPVDEESTDHGPAGPSPGA